MTDAAARAAECAKLIHDDFTLQIGEPISYKYDVEWLVCMETHIAAAIEQAVRAENRRVVAHLLDRARSWREDGERHDPGWKQIAIYCAETCETEAAAIRARGQG